MPSVLGFARQNAPGLDGAILAWRGAIGAEFVLTGRTDLDAAQRTTFQSTQLVPAILRPADRREVQECMRIANQFRVPVYPVSSGLNWGYGSRVPHANGCALLELGRLNRIVDLNEDLAYVTVEPGVTQRQLFEFLQERKSNLWMDATGGSPESSLIGNTVERGFGHTPYGDHFANSCAYEVVLANGDFLQTGFARFGNAQAATSYRWGMGPVLDGLFTQSSFGIVTRMTIWLMPAPEYFQAFYFRVDEDAALANVVNALRPLRMNGTIRSSMHLANDYKVMASMRGYPYDVTGGATPLMPDVMKTFRRELSCGAWNGSGALYGTRRQVAEARRLVKRALAGKVNKIQFLDDFLLSVANRFAKPLGALTGWDLSGALELVRPVYGLTKGVPTTHSLKSCFWRHRAIPADLDLDAGDCGLFWCAPVAPTDGGHVEAVKRIAYEVILAGGFEPMLTITLLTERSSSCVISLSYDRRIPGEDEKAQACYQKLLRALAESGYYSYRLGIQGMEQLNGAEGYNRFVRELKDSLDPNNVLSPGRYIPLSPS